MKTYNSLEEIQKCLQCKKASSKKNNAIDETNIKEKVVEKRNDKTENKTFEEIEYFDNVKTRVLKYVFYKKRTTEEVRKKFASMYDKEILNEVIDNLVELGYINDSEYINRTVNEYMALKNMSLREMKYKLIAKGLKSKTIEEYFEANYEVLLDYEKKSAKNIVIKKSKTMEEFELRGYLIKKGYKEESIKEAI